MDSGGSDIVLDGVFWTARKWDLDLNGWILAICTRYLELGGREVILLHLRLILVILYSCIILCIFALYGLRRVGSI